MSASDFLPQYLCSWLFILFSHDILPIAMGARLEDYERAAPYKSFLHVDQFESPQQLAEYLHILDKDDNKYNEYFQVKMLLTLC